MSGRKRSLDDEDEFAPDEKRFRSEGGHFETCGIRNQLGYLWRLRGGGFNTQMFSFVFGKGCSHCGSGG